MSVPRLPAELLIVPAVCRVRDEKCTKRTREETKDPPIDKSYQG
jgi:hypothetical protein